MKKRMIFLALAILMVFSMVVGCGKPDKNKYEGYVELLSDPHFDNGLRMTACDKANPRFENLKTFNFNNTAVTTFPDWRIFQWANYKHPLDAVEELTEGKKYTYQSESTKVVVDKEKNEQILGVTASKEYVDESGNHKPRMSQEHWPSLYFDQNIAAAPAIGELSDLVMDIELEMTHMEKMMTEEEFNANLHTAQFTWFLTVINKEKFNGVVNDYLWFGTMYYDDRYEYTQTLGMVDSGKDDATGKYMYTIGMDKILDKPFKQGGKIHVAISIYDTLVAGIKNAQENGYLKGCIPELLKVNYMNIGWEVPGTFDCEMKINNMSLKAKYIE